MSERKVLSKYYPPDFDPSQLKRQKNKGPASTVKVQTVRLMAPFSMKCLTCGEFIYKGRKFNSRKETPQAEKYLNIQIFFFHIRCTRCSAEITFRTDPKNNDYAMVRGAMRNMEPWRNKEQAAETEEERLNRLEAEGAEEEQDPEDPMQSLEKKTQDAQDEMAVADALDRIRMRNAARARTSLQDAEEPIVEEQDEDEQERQDAEAARKAFEKFQKATDMAVIEEEEDVVDAIGKDEASMPPPEPPRRAVKKKPKKDYAAALGIKKKKLV